MCYEAYPIPAVVITGNMQTPISREEVEVMIADAIRRHNRNAATISAVLGWIVLALFAEGMLRLVGVIEPLFPFMEIHL